MSDVTLAALEAEFGKEWEFIAASLGWYGVRRCGDRCWDEHHGAYHIRYGSPGELWALLVKSNEREAAKPSPSWSTPIRRPPPLRHPPVG